MKKMNENEIMDLTIDDFRDLTQEETQQDNFRRMFQIMGLIYKNQTEIKELLMSGHQATAHTL
jgi:hypothetical protein